jgi:hypothetical protein
MVWWAKYSVVINFCVVLDVSTVNWLQLVFQIVLLQVISPPVVAVPV